MGPVQRDQALRRGTVLAHFLCMTRPALVVSLALAVALVSVAASAEANPRGAKPVKAKVARPTKGEIRRAPNPLRALPKSKQGTVSTFLKDRKDWIRGRGEIFRKIAVEKNFSNDYVLFRNKKITAFLDWGDSKHPKFDPKRKTGEQHIMEKIPEGKRAHILVVPNAPREHIASRLGAQIGTGDLRKTLSTMKSAERLAKKLKIRNPQIYVNSESAISVGYLHVHIVGERTKDYPAAITK
jgi:hypothetical protein